MSQSLCAQAALSSRLKEQNINPCTGQQPAEWQLGVCRIVQHHFVESMFHSPAGTLGSPSLTVLQVTTRHFTALMFLIFSSSSSFFTSGWKYCSCSSASACGAHKMGCEDTEGRSHSINGLRANYYQPCLKQTAVWEQRNTTSLLLQTIHYCTHAVVHQHWNKPGLHKWEGLTTAGSTERSTYPRGQCREKSGRQM